MKKILYFILLFQCSIFAQNSGKACEKITKINSLLQINHYKMKPINDSLSANVYDAFLEILDNDKIYFTIEEINKIKIHRLKIDDYITNKNCSFLDEVAVIYKKALLRNLTIIQELEKQLELKKSS